MASMRSFIVPFGLFLLFATVSSTEADSDQTFQNVAEAEKAEQGEMMDDTKIEELVSVQKREAGGEQSRNKKKKNKNGRPKRKPNSKKARRASRRARNKKNSCKHGKKGKECRKNRRRTTRKKSSVVKKNNPGQKGTKSSKRRNKKGKYKNKKSCRNGKKGKECKRKGRKARRNGKGKGKGKGNGNGISKRRKFRASTCINVSCVQDACKYLKFMKDNVLNFLGRNERQKRQGGLVKKKLAKKGAFAEPAARLLQAGGGDLSNLSCSGSTSGTGAKQLLNLTTKLLACSPELQTACAPPDINQTKMTQCEKIARGFNLTMHNCTNIGIKGGNPCSCFQDSMVKKGQTALTKCNGKDEAKKAKAARNKCFKKMVECNSYADEAGKLQYVCKISVAEMLESLKNLVANNKTVAATLAKIATLTGVTAAKPGSSSSSSSSSSSNSSSASTSTNITGKREAIDDDTLFSLEGSMRGIKKRQTTTCSSLVTLTTTCSKALKNTPSSPKVQTSCKTPTSSTSVSCTTTEKASLQKGLDAVMVESLVIIASIVTQNEELSAATGTTVSTGSLNTSTKKALNRNRNILRQIMMDKLRN